MAQLSSSQQQLSSEELQESSSAAPISRAAEAHSPEVSTSESAQRGPESEKLEQLQWLSDALEAQIDDELEEMYEQLEILKKEADEAMQRRLELEAVLQNMLIEEAAAKYDGGGHNMELPVQTFTTDS